MPESEERLSKYWGSVIFCGKCGSTLVDEYESIDDETVRIQCAKCEHATTLRGFYLGKLILEPLTPAQLEEAKADAKIEEHLRVGSALLHGRPPRKAPDPS